MVNTEHISNVNKNLLIRELELNILSRNIDSYNANTKDPNKKIMRDLSPTKRHRMLMDYKHDHMKFV